MQNANIHCEAESVSSFGHDYEDEEVRRVPANIIVRSEDEEEEEEDEWDYLKIATLAFVIVAAVGIAIIIFLLVGSNKDDDNGNSSSSAAAEFSIMPSMAPTGCPLYRPFTAKDLHFLTIQAFDEPCSPQSKANAWMMQDPSLDHYGTERQRQRFALATLYYSTAGEDWDHNDLWLDYDHDECQWYNRYLDDDRYGTVCNEFSSILHLNLHHNNLNGTIPIELVYLPALTTLDIHHNQLYGPVPNFRPNLQVLMISYNQLFGRFTSELDATVVHLEHNLFEGNLPALLKILPKVSDLRLNDNMFTGTLPSSLAQLSNTLTHLVVANNQITGFIPRELANATLLQTVDVGGNTRLQGRVPTEFVALQNLTLLDISKTSIFGGLPQEMCAREQEGQLEVIADCEGGYFHCCPPNNTAGSTQANSFVLP